MPKKNTIEVKMGELTFDLLAGFKEGELLHKEITIREMTGADEEAVAKPEVRGNSGKVITTLLSNCVLRIGGLEKGRMSPAKWEDIIRKLYIGDRDYILLKIRELTYGNEMSVDTRCPFCKSNLKLDFFLEEIEIRPVDGDPGVITLELPKGYNANGLISTKGLAKLPNGNDQEQLDALARKNPGLANTTLITRCVYELENVNLTTTVFRDLSQKDREYIMQRLSDSNFGPKFLVTINCDNCGEEFETGVNPINFI